jgi:hypothetical protein
MSNKIICGIDPGNIESAYCIWNGVKVLEFGKVKNEILLDNTITFKNCYPKIYFAIEMIASYGLAVGAEVFSTCVWIGKFEQKILDSYPITENVIKVFRKEVKMHICHSMKAKDTNIRQALIDRFEPELQAKQRPKGLLKGLTADCWQAFALAVTYYDQNCDKIS